MGSYSSRCGPRGFSLIEILVALTVLGIGLVSLLAYLPVALNAAKQGQDMTKAILLGRQHIERVRAAAFDNISNADALATGGSFVADTAYPGFEYRIDISPAGAVILKDVRVSVRWRVRGNWVTETFETRIVKYDAS